MNSTSRVCDFGSRVRKVSDAGRVSYSGRIGRSGFSLVEVAIALGIVSFVLIALIGLLPIGLKHLQESEEAMASNLIFKDVNARVQRLSSRPSEFRDPANRDFVFVYDASGLLLARANGLTEGAPPPGLTHLAPRYIARVRVGNLANYPSHVSSDQMLGARIELFSATRIGADGDEEKLAERGLYLPMLADAAWPN